MALRPRGGSHGTRGTHVRDITDSQLAFEVLGSRSGAAAKQAEPKAMVKGVTKDASEIAGGSPSPTATATANGARTSPTYKLNSEPGPASISGRASPFSELAMKAPNGTRQANGASSNSPRPMAARGSPTATSGGTVPHTGPVSTGASGGASAIPISRTATRPISANLAKALAASKSLDIDPLSLTRPASAPLPSTAPLTPTLGSRNKSGALTHALAGGGRPSSAGKKDRALQPSPYTRPLGGASPTPPPKAAGLQGDGAPRLSAAPPLTPAPPRRSLSGGRITTPAIRRTSSVNQARSLGAATGPLTVDPPMRPTITRSLSLPSVIPSTHANTHTPLLPALPVPHPPHPPTNSPPGGTPSPRPSTPNSSPSPVPSPPSPCSVASTSSPRIKSTSGLSSPVSRPESPAAPGSADASASAAMARPHRLATSRVASVHESSPASVMDPGEVSAMAGASGASASREASSASPSPAARQPEGARGGAAGGRGGRSISAGRGKVAGPALGASQPTDPTGGASAPSTLPSASSGQPQDSTTARSSSEGPGASPRGAIAQGAGAEAPTAGSGAAAVSGTRGGHKGAVPKALIIPDPASEPPTQSDAAGAASQPKGAGVVSEPGVAPGSQGQVASQGLQGPPPSSPPRHSMAFMEGLAMLQISTAPLGSAALRSPSRPARQVSEPASPTSPWIKAGAGGPASPGMRSPNAFNRLSVDVHPTRGGMDVYRSLDFPMTSVVPLQLQRQRQRRLQQQLRATQQSVELKPLPDLPPHLPDTSTQPMLDLLAEVSDTAACMGVDHDWMCEMLSACNVRGSLDPA